MYKLSNVNIDMSYQNRWETTSSLKVGFQFVDPHRFTIPFEIGVTNEKEYLKEILKFFSGRANIVVDTYSCVSFSSIDSILKIFKTDIDEFEFDKPWKLTKSSDDLFTFKAQTVIEVYTDGELIDALVEINVFLRKTTL